MTGEIKKEVLEYLVELGEIKEASNKHDPIREIDGVFYHVDIHGNFVLLEDHLKQKEFICDPICTQTLSSLIDYVKQNPDSLKFDKIYIHVLTPQRAILESITFGDFKQKECYFKSTYSPPEFNFNNYYDKEEFLIKLNSLFVQNDDLLEVIGKIAKSINGVIKESDDDGITQKISVKKGISLENETRLPRLVELQPFRTFPEIVQPPSAFLLRARSEKENPENNERETSFSLFEADGGAWKNQAILQIKEYLQEQLKDINIMIIA